VKTDISSLLEVWRKAGRLDWVLTLGVIAVTLPTALTLYGELTPDKTVYGWIGVSALGSILPLFAMMLRCHWSQHRVSRRIVESLLATGSAPIGLFERLTEQDKRSLQYKVLSSIPLFPGQLVAFSDLIAERLTPHEKAVMNFEATVLLDLFQSLGLIEGRGQGRIAAVSEHAAALLHCVALGIREGVPLLTNWRIKDVTDQAFQRAFTFISQAEENRRALTRPSNWTPVRKNIPVSLIIIKCLRDGIDELLVRWSGSWTNFNFVGGTQEVGDINAEACAWREMNEELGLDRSGALSLDCIGSIASGPIKSERLGVYSTWNYTVFALNARSIARGALPVTLSRLMQPVAEFEVFTDERRLTKIRWMKWSEIASESDFARYGPELTRFLVEHFSSISSTFSFDIGA
jgi:8-oxo-dGTP pyrophosphatase MutT (NUDIX family)